MKVHRWGVSLVKPVLDLEPRYDHHRHVGTGQYYTAREVPMDHPGAGEAPPWYEVVCSEGGEGLLE